MGSIRKKTTTRLSPMAVAKKNDPIMEVTVAETVLWFSPKSKQELGGMPDSKVIAREMV